MCEPLVFDLLFTRCQAATRANRPHANLLPLHLLLNTLPRLGPLSDWSLRWPVSDLIDSLFAPQVRSRLECARIVAQYTHSLDQIALGYILNGEIIPLAALLLVVPFTKAEFETLKSYTSIKDIASLAIHGQSISRATCYAVALLNVFEEDVDKLTSKFNNPQKESSQEIQSFVNGLFMQELKRLFRVPRVGQSFANRSIQQIDNVIFPRRLLSKSSQTTDITGVDEMMCRYISVLVEKSDVDDTSWFPQVNSFFLDKVLLHIRGGLPALISAIRTFCNNENDAEKYFKGCHPQHVNRIYMCLLHVVLSSLVKYEYLSKWSPGESLVKLILLLFLQPELKPTLECAQLLAKRSDLVRELAWNLIRLGQPIQLAGLLLVAHENAVKPSPLDETIMKTVVSKVCCGESIAAIAGAAGLCEIFEKAGNTLAEYWSTHNDEHEPVGVIVEVAARIQSSGIQVLSVDVDLTGIYSTSGHPEMLKLICERLGIKIDRTSELLEISRKSPFPSEEIQRRRYWLKLPSPLLDLTWPVEISSERLGLLGLLELLGEDVWKN